MIDIKIEINGRKVKTNDIKDVLEKAIIQNISETIKNKVASLKCKEHDEIIKIIVNGKDLNSLSIEFSGCCKSFHNQLKEILSDWLSNTN